VTILANSIALGSEHYDQSKTFTKVQDIANIIFTVIFALEMVLKIVGSGAVVYLFKLPNQYKVEHLGKDPAFANKKYLNAYQTKIFNIFDGIVVVMSLLEYGFVAEGNKSGLSALRAFRLLRILKLAKNWQGLQRQAEAIKRSFSEAFNLGLLIIFFIFINALVGKQLFGHTHDEENRLNFKTFGSSMFTVFVSLTGKWIDPMRS
jgi:voltage-gated sodium channel type V alpha